MDNSWTDYVSIVKNLVEIIVTIYEGVQRVIGYIKKGTLTVKGTFRSPSDFWALSVEAGVINPNDPVTITGFLSPYAPLFPVNYHKTFPDWDKGLLQLASMKKGGLMPVRKFRAHDFASSYDSILRLDGPINDNHYFGLHNSGSNPQFSLLCVIATDLLSKALKTRNFSVEDMYRFDIPGFDSIVTGHIRCMDPVYVTKIKEILEKL